MLLGGRKHLRRFRAPLFSTFVFLVFAMADPHAFLSCGRRGVGLLPDAQFFNALFVDRPYYDVPQNILTGGYEVERIHNDRGSVQFYEGSATRVSVEALCSSRCRPLRAFIMKPK